MISPNVISFFSFFEDPIWKEDETFNILQLYQELAHQIMFTFLTEDSKHLPVQQ